MMKKVAIAFALFSSQPFSFPQETSFEWVFEDNQGGLVDLEWCGSEALEAVRSIYVDAYLDKDLYRALVYLHAQNESEAKLELSSWWDARKTIYEIKLNSNPPRAYFAIAKEILKPSVLSYLMQMV